MRKSKTICTFILIMLSVSFIISCSNDKEESIPSSPPSINIADSLAIVDYYHSMKGGEWLDSWDLRDPTTWNNVKMAYDESTGLKYVYGIHINRYYCVEGSRLPETIGNFKHLSELVIMEGPGIVGKIPESLYDCPLVYLYIQHSPTIEGPLSSGIGKLGTTLQHLCITDCPSFISELPAELGKCNKARYICLGWSGFYGKIPIELNQLIIHPMLSHNHFTEIDWRFFTEDIGYIPHASYNDFSGEIPEIVLNSTRWKEWGDYLGYPFNEGYGFSNYVAPDF